MLNIFLISSPILEIISHNIIARNQLKADEILIVVSRRYTLGLLDYERIQITETIIDRILLRCCLPQLSGLSLWKEIRKKSNLYKMYIPWDLPILYQSMKSKDCIEVNYMEEGQMAYLPIETYKYSNNLINEMARLYQYKERSRRLSINQDYAKFAKYYRSAGHGFHCFSPDAFPNIPKRKKIFYESKGNYDEVYKYKTIGVSNIGVMCAQRRLGNTDAFRAVEKLADAMRGKSYIKLHPSQYSIPKLENELKQYVNDKYCGRVEILNADTIIELEMMKEKKILHGPLSSLKLYAALLGSEYINISLY